MAKWKIFSKSSVNVPTSGAPTTSPQKPQEGRFYRFRVALANFHPLDSLWKTITKFFRRKEMGVDTTPTPSTRVFANVAVHPAPPLVTVEEPPHLVTVEEPRIQPTVTNPITPSRVSDTARHLNTCIQHVIDKLPPDIITTPENRTLCLHSFLPPVTDAFIQIIDVMAKAPGKTFSLENKQELMHQSMLSLKTNNGYSTDELVARARSFAAQHPGQSLEQKSLFGKAFMRFVIDKNMAYLSDRGPNPRLNPEELWIEFLGFFPASTETDV